MGVGGEARVGEFLDFVCSKNPNLKKNKKNFSPFFFLLFFSGS